MIGKAGKTALGTLVERKSRYLVPVALPGGHDAGSVRDGIIESVADMPANLRKSITWDQGTEMAEHAALTLATDIPVSEITGDSHYIQAVADEINDRPRAILGFRTPAEVFAELLLADNPGDNLSSIASTG